MMMYNTAHADPARTESGNAPAIDEAFLLFLASMEQIDGEWIHAIDMDKPPVQDQNAVDQPSPVSNNSDAKWEETE